MFSSCMLYGGTLLAGSADGLESIPCIFREQESDVEVCEGSMLGVCRALVFASQNQHQIIYSWLSSEALENYIITR